MSEYIVTYPVHLGQEVWVDIKALPSGIIQTRKRYLKAEIRSLIVQMKGRTERKSAKFTIGENWLDGNGGYKFGYKHFKISLGAIGKTVFLEKPSSDA